MKKLLASLSVSVILSGGFVTEKANAKDVTDSDQIVTVNNNSDAARSVSPSAKSITIRNASGGGIGEKIDTPSGVQLEWSIESPVEEHQKSFRVEADGQVDLHVDRNSGALLVRVDGSDVALIDAPWARDAAGKALPTHYEVAGDTFTQVVEVNQPDVAYPIEADPRVNWGIVSGHIYFSKEETRRMAASSAAGAAISPFWVLVPPPFGEVLGAWWADNSVNVTLWATAAVAQDKCLALKVGATGSVSPPSLGVTPEHYTQGCA